VLALVAEARDPIDRGARAEAALRAHVLIENAQVDASPLEVMTQSEAGNLPVWASRCCSSSTSVCSPSFIS